MANVLSPDYYRMLNELQSIDFVIVELTLYLDTHPDDSKALAQYTQFQRRKMVLMQQYEALYGPLLEYGHQSTGSRWSWPDGPWPWQV